MSGALAANVPRRRFTGDDVLRMVDDGILREDDPLESSTENWSS
jgi:hypothetical protein